MTIVRSSVLALLLLVPGSALAAVTMTADDEVIVEAHEVIDDDLIVWADYVRIDGLVKGDLVAFGSEVVVEGIVEQDLFAAGQTVYLNGQVGDDARIGAYAVALGDDARVGDDLFDLGYSLETKPGSTIGGTLYAASRQCLLAGQVVEDLRVRAGSLELRGLTAGDVRAVVGGLEGVTHSQLVVDLAFEIPEVPEGVTLGAGAAVGGDLVYRSVAQASVDPGARVDGETRHEAWRSAPDGPIELPSLDEEESLFADLVADLTPLLLVGLLLAVAVPSWLRERGDLLRGGPAGALGWGIGTLVFGVIASFLVGVVGFTLLAMGLAMDAGGLAATAIGIGALLQLALLAFFGIALLYVAPVLVSAGIGAALLERFRLGSGTGASVLVDALLLLAVGAVVYAALLAIPGIGWLVAALGALAGLGALALWLRDVFLGAD